MENNCPVCDEDKALNASITIQDARTVEDDKDAFTDDMVTFDVDFDGARVISRYICSDCYTSDNHLTLEAQA
jgi:hypothetical protein